MSLSIPNLTDQEMAGEIDGSLPLPDWDDLLEKELLEAFEQHDTEVAAQQAEAATTNETMMAVAAGDVPQSFSCGESFDEFVQNNDTWLNELFGADSDFLTTEEHGLTADKISASSDNILMNSFEKSFDAPAPELQSSNSHGGVPLESRDELHTTSTLYRGLLTPISTNVMSITATGATQNPVSNKYSPDSLGSMIGFTAAEVQARMKNEKVGVRNTMTEKSEKSNPIAGHDLVNYAGVKKPKSPKAKLTVSTAQMQKKSQNARSVLTSSFEAQQPLVMPSVTTFVSMEHYPSVTLEQLEVIKKVAFNKAFATFSQLVVDGVQNIQQEANIHKPGQKTGPSLLDQQVNLSPHLVQEEALQPRNCTYTDPATCQNSQQQSEVVIDHSSVMPGDRMISDQSKQMYVPMTPGQSRMQLNPVSPFKTPKGAFGTPPYNFQSENQKTFPTPELTPQLVRQTHSNGSPVKVYRNASYLSRNTPQMATLGHQQQVGQMNALTAQQQAALLGALNTQQYANNMANLNHQQQTAHVGALNPQQYATHMANFNHQQYANHMTAVNSPQQATQVGAFGYQQHALQTSPFSNQPPNPQIGSINTQLHNSQLALQPHQAGHPVNPQQVQQQQQNRYYYPIAAQPTNGFMHQGQAQFIAQQHRMQQGPLQFQQMPQQMLQQMPIPQQMGLPFAVQYQPNYQDNIKNSKKMAAQAKANKGKRKFDVNDFASS